MSRKVSDLLPEVQNLALQLLEACLQLDIKLGIVQTLRTWAEQDALYAQGRTAPGPQVTHARGGESWHNFGRAFDVAILSFTGDPDPKNIWNGPWETVGIEGEKLGLKWGGRWKDKKQDRPHFEYHPNLTLADARAAKQKETQA